MRHELRILCIGLALVTATVQSQALAQAPAAPTPTLWSFLGIPQAASKVNAQIFNRRGNTPRLESRPPLRSLADPRNLEKGMPEAVKKAAEIKQKEDLAPQKIKAIKYLASIGCGCYDANGEVTAALVDSMEDCTENVRKEAIEAIKTAASEDPCCQCGSKCCCKEAVLMKLAERAYKRGPDGCYLEPSERVRTLAAEALTVCCSTQEPVEILQEEAKPNQGENPEPPPQQQNEPTPADGSVEPQNDGNTEEALEDGDSTAGATSATNSLSAYINAGTGTYRPAVIATVSAESVRETKVVAAETSEPTSETAKVIPVIPRRGEVTEVNSANGTARVKFNSLGEVPNGNLVMAFHQFLFSKSQIGEYMVVATQGGEAIIRNADGGALGKLSKGDLIIVK